MKVLISAVVLAGLLLGLTASSSALAPRCPNKTSHRPPRHGREKTRGNTPPSADYFAPDLIDHDPYSGQAPGLPGFVQGLMIQVFGLPDWVDANEEMIAEGDQVVTRWTGRGTQTSLLMGLPSSGNESLVVRHALVQIR